MDTPQEDPMLPLSEVGSRGLSTEEINNDTAGPSRADAGAPNLLTNMEALLSRLLAATQNTTKNDSTPRLVQFDPDEADADIIGWCNITEIIMNSRELAGPDLLLALTHALKGRAAKCLTILSIADLTWPHVK